MILVNNRDKIEWEAGMTITRLLEKCHFMTHRIHVFVNETLIKRDAYDTWIIQDGDQVRVLHMLGGG